MQKPVPASYGQSTYHAEHAFLFTAADGTSRFGRYRWVPEAGEAYLSPDDASKRSANFLREELESRLRKGPVVFRLLLQLAGGAGGDRHPSDGRGRRAPLGVRPHQPDGRHRSLGRSDSAGPIGRLLHLVRPPQQGSVRDLAKSAAECTIKSIGHYWMSEVSKKGRARR